MTVGKEFRQKIKSVQSTQKITHAMEMVAASKMRKAQARMRASRPYARNMMQVIRHVAQGHLAFQHPYLMERIPKRVGMIVISSDRGLCGSLNTNLFKVAVNAFRGWAAQGLACDLCVMGRKAEQFFKHTIGQTIASIVPLGDHPNLTDVVDTVKILLDAYLAGRIDHIYILYNEFVNTMKFVPKLSLMVPVLEELPTQKPKATLSWDYIYEPNASWLLDVLLVRYIESTVYQAIAENNACEQSARMVAMKSATDNAGELIRSLTLKYNKARQAAITRELSEIVAGAAAV
jgi:F-type H+-transporting ATPase subunit gamma